MPIDIVPQDEITTTLTSPAFGGDTTINVADGTGIVAGDTLRVGDPPGELAIVGSVAGNTITLSSAISATHLTGELVDRLAGGVDYEESELTQDACASGRRLAFAKTSEPVSDGDRRAVRLGPLAERESSSPLRATSRASTGSR